MKLSMGINYSGGFKEAVDRVVELEKAGLDQVWIAEAYSYDAISQVGYLAAKTNRVEIGTGIVNVYSRTAALMAMTAAGCDYVSDGRFILGLGASGPQVIEGQCNASRNTSMCVAKRGLAKKHFLMTARLCRFHFLQVKEPD
jgi:alkanesulfonate monooxygenase SsuD/methylene tetrahydromethanopterin reductase-like flavin-dependent oxidoreductase (luciferase family)